MNDYLWNLLAWHEELLIKLHARLCIQNSPSDGLGEET